jgi:hypothetical protein
MPIGPGVQSGELPDPASRERPVATDGDKHLFEKGRLGMLNAAGLDRPISMGPDANHFLLGDSLERSGDQRPPRSSLTESADLPRMVVSTSH